MNKQIEKALEKVQESQERLINLNISKEQEYLKGYKSGADTMAKSIAYEFNQKDQRIAELEEKLEAAVELIPEASTPHQISDEDYELLQAVKQAVNVEHEIGSVEYIKLNQDVIDNLLHDFRRGLVK